MAKKQQTNNNKRLIKKKTIKRVKRVTPWAAGLAAIGGLVAAIADRTVRTKVKTMAADAVEKVRPQAKSSSDSAPIVPQESGAV